MFFRNLQLFRLTAGQDATAEAFQEQMSPYVFQACSALMPESRGWIPPRGDDRLLYTLNQHWLAALGTEQKLLPASVVRQEVQQRAADLEARSGFKPSRKRIRDLKDQVTDELLPRAFSRYRTTFCWIDPVGGWLVIDAPTSKRADEVTEWLHKSSEALAFEPVKAARSPASAMTEWLVEREGPAGFSIDRECVLQSPLEEKSTVRYSHHSLVDTDEIRNHITRDGKVPIQLALTWEDRVSFVLTDKLEVRRVQFLDITRGDTESDADSAEEQFQSDFTLMTAMLGRFLSDLLETLGGVDGEPRTPEEAAAAQ
ncbi:MAG: recombination-associated protein RdgC [Betaproteobacteria bacterium]|nr:recombination-associated protein RdgC [Betaproteobacteria bacterium]